MSKQNVRKSFVKLMCMLILCIQAAFVRKKKKMNMKVTIY